MGSYNSLYLGRVNIISLKSASLGLGFFFNKEDWISNNGDIKYPRPVFRKKLKDIKTNLELMGYTLSAIEKKFYKFNLRPGNFLKKERGGDLYLSFEDFWKIIAAIDISLINSEYHENIIKILEKSPGVVKFYKEKNFYIKTNKSGEAILWDLHELQYIDSFLLLRCLMEREDIAEIDVTWDYYDLVNGGWLADDLDSILESPYNFIIIGEGKYDSLIIKKSFEIIFPEIKIFFSFLENNPLLSGASNLTTIYHVLNMVQPSKNIIFLLDNDIEGNISKEEIKKLIERNNNKNFKAISLIDHPSFKIFPCILSSGEEKRCDINKKAVEIECFLDLNIDDEHPNVFWTKNYLNPSERKNYGGLKEADKTKIRKKFFNNQKINNYDYSKIKSLLQYIIKEAIAIQERNVDIYMPNDY